MPQMYERVYAYGNGQLLGEAGGGTINWTGDGIPVTTLVKDYAGVTPAPKGMTAQVDSFVPAAGLEFDVVKKFLDNEFITMKFQLGGSGVQLTSEGHLTGPSLTYSATDSTKLSFGFMGEAKPFE